MKISASWRLDRNHDVASEFENCWMIIIFAMKTSFDLLWISYVRQRHLNACEVGPCEVVAWEFILENVWVAWPLGPKKA